MEQPDDLVVLGVYYDVTSAYIIKGLLEENGIHATVVDELSSVIAPVAVQARLLVARDRLEEALRIVAQNEEEAMENEDGRYD